MSPFLLDVFLQGPVDWAVHAQGGQIFCPHAQTPLPAPPGLPQINLQMMLLEPPASLHSARLNVKPPSHTLCRKRLMGFRAPEVWCTHGAWHTPPCTGTTGFLSEHFPGSSRCHSCTTRRGDPTAPTSAALAPAGLSVLEARSPTLPSRTVLLQEPSHSQGKLDGAEAPWAPCPAFAIIPAQQSAGGPPSAGPVGAWSLSPLSSQLCSIKGVPSALSSNVFFFPSTIILLPSPAF